MPVELGSWPEVEVSPGLDAAVSRWKRKGSCRADTLFCQTVTSLGHKMTIEPREAAAADLERPFGVDAQISWFFVVLLREVRLQVCG